MGKVRVEEVRGRRRRRRRRLGRRRTRRVRRQVEPGKFFVETIPISAPTYFLQHTTQACTTNNSEYWDEQKITPETLFHKKLLEFSTHPRDL